MQPYRPFFLNYPPPPIPTRESIINEGLKILQQSKNDEQWLKNWLERKQEKERISLSDYRQKLIQHAHLLQQYEHALETSNHEILSQLKIRIEQSSDFIYDSNLVNNIQKQIRRRKSKRARLRRQKDKKLIPYESPLADQTLNNEKSLNEKIQDINSIIQIVEQLKQLKSKRQKRQKVTTDTDYELTEIQNACNEKLLEYKAQMENKSPKELFNYLFNNQGRSFYESSNPDAQIFLQAHENINNLAQIRQQWDQYLTSQKTSLDNQIPLKWYESQKPCDSNWARYIFHNKD